MERFTVKIMVGNFNTGVHYTKTIELESSGREGAFCDDLKAACRKEVPYNACWWVMEVRMDSKEHFVGSFN